MEYSDLEDISPGGLSGDSSERPPTPDTPETAAPAADFTHPGLGFWAAPFSGNLSTNAAETGESFVSDAERRVEAASSICQVVQPDLEVEHHHTLDAEPQYEADRLLIGKTVSLFAASAKSPPVKKTKLTKGHPAALYAELLNYHVMENSGVLSLLPLWP